MPLISVIIPLYNHERYVEEAVTSVLNQTVSDFELIIINDGSEDKSEEVVNGIKDQRIKYFTQQNQGAHNTINKGIGLAKGQYVSILNSDDVYLPDRLEKCLGVIAIDESVDAVCSGIEYIDEVGKFLKQTTGAEENWVDHDLDSSFKGENDLTLDLLAGNFLKTTSNLFCSKQCFETIGLFRDLRYAHDYDFFLKLSFSCNAKLIDEPLLKYRVHSTNTLKENQAATDLECALVIADFLTSYDLKSILNPLEILNLDKMFNSLNTHRGDRILLTLIFATNISESNGSILDMLIKDRNDSFWNTGYMHLSNYHDGWQARDKLHDEWNKLYLQYLESEERLGIALNSKGYRVEKFIKNSLGKIKSLIRPVSQ